MTTPSNDELREKLAAIEHERWADWQKWMHSVLRRSGELTEGADEILQRWDRQIATGYKDLSPEEKASDMEQVDRYWPLIEDYLAQDRQELLKRIEGELPELSPHTPNAEAHFDKMDNEHPCCERVMVYNQTLKSVQAIINAIRESI